MTNANVCDCHIGGRRLPHSKFVGLREDKDARKMVKEHSVES
jgi:hypothetical protein